jgi:hypothetical protein
MACSWSLGAGTRAPLYVNANVTGRRCTEADVERLRATVADTVASEGKVPVQSMAAELNTRLARVGAELESV